MSMANAVRSIGIETMTAQKILVFQKNTTSTVPDN